MKAWLLLIAACGTSNERTDLQAPSTYATVQAPRDVATVHGVAHDAMAGAVVLDDAGRTLYVEGIHAWPQEVEGKRLIVTGRIVTRQGPACVHDPTPCQGISGSYLVISGATFEPE